MNETMKCGHPAYSCAPPDGKTYCSTSCEDAKSLTELVCQCANILSAADSS
jgi:hypothetical protein